MQLADYLLFLSSKMRSMKKWLLLLALAAGWGKGYCQVPIQADLPKYKAADLLKRIQNPDTIYVVNFWATWCAPCVQEIPELEELQLVYQAFPVKVLMVSLDFKDHYPLKLQSFMRRQKMANEVIFLDEDNPNKYIPKIYPKWSGSIPATWMLYKKANYNRFVERQVRFEEMQKAIDDLLDTE